jgi:hypothetical protein
MVCANTLSVYCANENWKALEPRYYNENIEQKGGDKPGGLTVYGERSPLRDTRTLIISKKGGIRYEKKSRKHLRCFVGLRSIHGICFRSTCTTSSTSSTSPLCILDWGLCVA